MGLRPLAAGGIAAFAGSFGVYVWLTHDVGSAAAALRAEPYDVAIKTGTVIAESSIPSSIRPHLTGVEAGNVFTSRWQDALPEPSSAGVSSRGRSTFERSDASLHASLAAASFNDRFGDVLASGVRSAVAAAPRTPAKRTAAAAPRAAARAVAAKAAPKQAIKAGFQLASASETVSLAYAPADSVVDEGVTSSLNGLEPKDLDPLADVDTSHTAIYDITSHTVYLPNGRRLEAHSGLGSHKDDPRSVAMRNTGATPPNVYDLRMRESLFHGVRALRLIPKDGSRMYGRSGILAHSYMLGPNGQSNGCVSFNDYPAFLEAYLQGDVTRLVVVEHLANAPSSKTAADWFTNTLKDIFRRS